MAHDLKPYQLVQTYTEARHSRFNSWVFSVLAAGCAIAGFGTFLSDLPLRWQLSFGLWSSSLILVNRGSTASRQANLYAKRVAALEGASEDASLYNLMKSVQPSLPAIQMQATLEPAMYNWQDACDEGVGFIIAGNSGSGKSSVATWLAGLLTEKEPAQCLVLDPHWNDIWKQQGLPAIGHISEIEAAIKALLRELDERCDRKGRGEPLGEPLLIIADEIGSCLKRFKKPEAIETALQRLGSEGRKFGMSLIAINQSQNVDDIGISAAYRNNYVLILLGAAARRQAQQMGKEFQHLLKGVAYPCVVSGAAENSLAIHPTHGSYQMFRKKGNPPQNLSHIRQLPLAFAAGLELEADSLPAAIPPGSIQQINATTQREIVEKCFDLPASNEHEMQKQITFDIDDLLPELQPIVKLSIKQGGWIKASDCKRNIRDLRSTSNEVIREYFLILSGQGAGCHRREGENLEYTAFEG